MCMVADADVADEDFDEFLTRPMTAALARDEHQREALSGFSYFLRHAEERHAERLAMESARSSRRTSQSASRTQSHVNRTMSHQSKISFGTVPAPRNTLPREPPAMSGTNVGGLLTGTGGTRLPELKPARKITVRDSSMTGGAMKGTRLFADAPEGTRKLGGDLMKSPYMQKVPGPDPAPRANRKSTNRQVSWHQTFGKIGGKEELSNVLIAIGDTADMAGGQ